jgi:hypothetical protein
MRTWLAIGASAVAGLAAVIASLDGDADIVPFFVGLTFLGGVAAASVHEPFIGRRQLLAQSAALVWVGAAGVIGALLLWSQALCACTRPYPSPEATYLGLTATVYHLVGVYVGGALVAVAAFSRALRLRTSR